MAKLLVLFVVVYWMLHACLNRHVDEVIKQVSDKTSHHEYAFNTNIYNKYDDIMTWLEGDAINKCPGGLICSMENIGSSFEGRELKLFKIRKNGSGRKIVWSDSLIHPREWLSGATVLKLLDNLLSNYSRDPDVTSLLDKHDFHFLPVMNPDGYVYTWESERFWRKSRNINPASSCVGTDLNRNYDQQWMSDGASLDPCAETYAGPAPASEPETRAVQNYLLANGADLLTFMSIHAGAQMWIFPYSHTEAGSCVRTTDHDALTRVANSAANATRRTFGNKWPHGTVCEKLNPASGGSCDYAYVKAGVRFSFTPEFRGPGSDPPASAIQPSFQEIWNGYKALIQAIDLENS